MSDHDKATPLTSMTLRDYFAGQALLGVCAGLHGVPIARTDDYAAHCYAMADAMLAER